MRVSTKRYQNLLSDASPGTSLALVRFLKKKNRRSKRIPRWRVRQVQNFVMALNATAFEFERARREGRAATLAWSARNFLELSIWTDYCCASEENAKRFKDDTKRDLFGMVASAKGANLTPELHKQTNDLLQRFERIFNTQSFKVTDEFKRVGKAATELGRGGEFFSHNKLFSKMAHPTAFVVNSKKTKRFDRRFQAAVFIGGVQFALKSMVTLINFFMTHFPDPNLRRRLNTSRP
jgi:hypothetical protein